MKFQKLMRYFLTLSILALLTGCTQKSFEITPKQDINAPQPRSNFDGTTQHLGVPQNQTPLFEEKFYIKHRPDGDVSAPPQSDES